MYARSSTSLSFHTSVIWQAYNHFTTAPHWSLSRFSEYFTGTIDMVLTTLLDL